MTEDPAVPPESSAAASGGSSPDDLDALWSTWIGSPDDPAARTAVVEALTETFSEALTEALDDAADTAAGLPAAPPAAGDPPATDGPDPAAALDEELTYGADDVLAEQLDSFGTVGNTSDGELCADGTSDYDWS